MLSSVSVLCVSKDMKQNQSQAPEYSWPEMKSTQARHGFGGPDMVHAFIVMYFTWDDNEGDHNVHKGPIRHLWSTYKIGVVLLTKARWKRFIKWPLRGQESSALVPLRWKGLWLFLHPHSFGSLSANTMLDVTEQDWNSMDGARSRISKS